MRLAYVSCVRQLEEVRNADYCDYIRPPIDKYGTLQFDAYDEIREVGYYHGKTYFAGLRKAGQLWFMAPPSGLDNRRGSLEQLGMRVEVDLAAEAGQDPRAYAATVKLTAHDNEVYP